MSVESLSWPRNKNFDLSTCLLCANFVSTRTQTTDVLNVFCKACGTTFRFQTAVIFYTFTKCRQKQCLPYCLTIKANTYLQMELQIVWRRVKCKYQVSRSSRWLSFKCWTRISEINPFVFATCRILIFWICIIFAVCANCFCKHQFGNVALLSFVAFVANKRKPCYSKCTFEKWKASNIQPNDVGSIHSWQSGLRNLRNVSHSQTRFPDCGNWVTTCVGKMFWGRTALLNRFWTIE